jgi:hypothetical protein
MNKRNCRHCQKQLSADLLGRAEFCNSTCRSRMWRENKKQKPSLDHAQHGSENAVGTQDNQKIVQPLRGVVDVEPVLISEPIVATDHQEPNQLTRKLLLKQKVDELEALQKKRYQDVQSASDQIRLIKGEQIKGRFSPYILLTPDQRSEKLKSVQAIYETVKQQYEKILREWAQAFYELANWKEEPSQQDNAVSQADEPLPEPVTVKPQTEKPNSPKQSSKVISSKDLRDKTYPCLNFSGKWFELIGKPAVVFHAAVHGKPGEGKSTFCFQWAHYLAEEFGKVVYISAEEGFSKTLRDKLINTKADSSSLCFADLRSCNEITTEIGRYDFHFIIIDSLDTLKIDAQKLKQLREHYPLSAFITISQSTKDGKMRGSQEIIHDSDIEIRVINGTASTAKNRFKEKGKTYNVFSEIVVESQGQSMTPPRNII